MATAFSYCQPLFLSSGGKGGATTGIKLITCYEVDYPRREWKQMRALQRKALLESS
jgi:hypothetical protein